MILGCFSVIMSVYIIIALVFQRWNPVFRALPGEKQGHSNFTSKKRVDYLTRVIAIWHGIIVTVLAFFGCFYLCDNPQASIFTDMQCLLTPKLYHVISASITIGYLTFDFLATFLFNHENNALTYQTYAHHVAGIVSFYSALVLRPSSSAFIIGTVANQFTEISTPFMNFRQLLFTHKLNDSKIGTVNTILFALTFLFGRLLYQIYFTYISLPWLIEEHQLHVIVDYSCLEMAGFYFCCLA